MTVNVEAFWSALRREQFLLVGIGGVTGAAVARLFRRMGVPFRVSDSLATAEIARLVLELGIPEEDAFIGFQLPEQLEHITQVLVSPGVPRSLHLLEVARTRKIPVWCDFDLLYPLFAHKTIAAITGTDGKTTTTTLLGHLLESSRSLVVAGNTNMPLCAAYDELLDRDVIVLELSSFMLEDLRQFRSNVATVLNIAEDHVDRYPNLLEYAAAKRNIVRYARPGDVFVQNMDDPVVSDWLLPTLAVRTVSLTKHAHFYLDGSALCFGSHRLATGRLQVRGQHLLCDVLVALAMAIEIGLDPEEARSRLESFQGVPHRFEFVAQYKGVDVIDDSKATSVHAVARGLENFTDRKVVLLLGGRDKMLDAHPLRRFAPQLVAVVGYGEAGPRLLAQLGLKESYHVHRFDEAVRVACQLVRPGDALLLSPACTSFDQHRDYQERGEQFRQLAQLYLSA